MSVVTEEGGGKGTSCGIRAVLVVCSGYEAQVEVWVDHLEEN